MGVEVIASIKANAYGHGAVPVARTLAAEGVDRLATGSFEEAVAVREAGVGLPILMLPAALPSGIGHLLRHDLTPTVCDLDAAWWLREAPVAGGIRYEGSLIHLPSAPGLGVTGLVV